MSEWDDLIIDEDVNRENDDKPNNYIAFVMDHSGSMGSVAERSREDFNEKLVQTKKDGEGMNNYVTIIEFDGTIYERSVNEDIENVEPLDDYWIGGTTSLYDAINKAINIVSSSMSDKKNDAALITIITDGYENSSKELPGEKGRRTLKKRIEELQDSGNWTFVFMGADQDVMKTAVEGMGISRLNTMSYSNDDEGIKERGETYSIGTTTWFKGRAYGKTSSRSFFENTSGDTIPVENDDKSCG